MRKSAFRPSLMTALVINAFTVASIANATPPPPQQRDVAVTDALNDLQFLEGTWEGDELAWPKRHETRFFAFEFGAIYTKADYRSNGLWQPTLTLTFDSVTNQYKLFSSISGGYEVVDVAHPDANTLVWVTHLDGPAIRTTFSYHDGQLHEMTALLDVDGEVKPMGEAVLVRTAAARLHFTLQMESSRGVH